MAMPDAPGSTEAVIPLHVEEVTVGRRKVAHADVHIRVQTTSHEYLVDQPVTKETIEIERVPVGKPVDAIPPVREEGDTTIIPVVEEIIVVERRLILKEEVRLHRVRTTEHFRETVVLRKQEAVIERTAPGARPGLSSGSTALQPAAIESLQKANPDE